MLTKYLKIQNYKKKKKNKAIRDIRRENYDGDKILRDIRTLFETLDEEDYYKPI